MAPYEALYGRRCYTPTCWTELGEQQILGLELIADTEDKVKLIRGRLKEAFDRQKSYADLKRKDIEHSVGDYVFLKVSPWKKIMRRYCSDPSHVVPVEEIDVRLDLTIEEKPMQILEHDVKVLRKKSVSLVKVLWHNHGAEEATWEPEEAMRLYGYLWSLITTRSLMAWWREVCFGFRKDWGSDPMSCRRRHFAAWGWQEFMANSNSSVWEFELVFGCWEKIMEG
ncbi:uncharacterized protein LOC128296636 [Gossypium arboreum]|uniref:uncharacterized protein LOC128296636 n=1 Tax=Gossypium arboreum TaxID=29729 RepID=UPI0022F14BFF|nr:uncharacterized protein LOC128296636 [Gossypium arboreum]